MKKRRLSWQIVAANLAVISLTVLTVAWYSISSIREFHINHLKDILKSRATTILTELAPILNYSQGNNYKARLKEKLSKDSIITISEIRLINNSGTTLFTLDNDPPDQNVNYKERPETTHAFNGKTGWWISFNKFQDENLLNVAIPAGQRQRKNGEKETFALCLSTPLQAIDESLRAIKIKIFSGTLLLLLFIGATTLWVSERLAMPLALMRKAADRFARGDFSEKLEINPEESMSTEISGLANSLNIMAAQLADRIETVRKQHNQLNAVFSSMVEPVFALDMNGKILNLNKAASRLFETVLDRASGRQIDEIIRNRSLFELVQQTSINGNNYEDEIDVVQGNDAKYFHIHVMPLKDSKKRNIGILIVMNDITRLKRLEDLRRDFVANVSHELKTPVTSIKGYVEALIDGAVNEPETAEKFLAIVNRQANRLNAIIDDLLSLSRIEQDKQNASIDFIRWNIRDMLDAVVQTCSIRAMEKNIDLHVSCPRDIEAEINHALMEQAVVNLVVNAIKYSEHGSEVNIKAEYSECDGSGRMVKISVQDFGVGIPAQHLPRLFERFYRSDKARSRRLGGTGLGLAIVKHIADAHGGKVTVTSEPDKGSTFFIYIPLKREE